MFVISVDDPQKVGDPIRQFTMYTVHTRVREARRISEPDYSRFWSPDHLPSVPKICILRAAPLFGFPLAVRDVVKQQPRCGSTAGTREEPFWPLR